uniref:Uncharacterized protein n=1 Tax=Megaselia scalaris TaxID=36166 RepID=T1GDR8_MEGSC
MTVCGRSIQTVF